jgi:HemY protein
VLPEVALEGARLLNVAGRGGRAAGAIEDALQAAPSEWDENCLPLLEEYARAHAFPARGQLEQVERWLADAPRDDAKRAVLLRTAGTLCLREQLWGKARSYLNESLQIAKDPATLLALARLAEALGDEAEAAQHYREAALGYGQPGATVFGDSTRPLIRDQQF